MSRTFNLWTLAQAELLQIAARAHDFLVAHGLAGGVAQPRPVTDEAGHLAPADALPAHMDALEGAHTAFPPGPPAPHVPHDY